MINKKAKKSQYVAGLPAYNVFILLVLVLGLSAIGYFILRSRASVVVKPPLQGLLDRNHAPEAAYTKSINGFVVNVDWKDVQPNSSTDFVTTPIDNAISQARSSGLKLKIRLMTGSHSPEWAKQLGGSPVTYYEPIDQNTPSYTIPRFWTPEFKQSYNDLQSKLAAKYDSVDEVREVVINRCMTVYAEPYVRGITEPRNAVNLLSAGYTVAADQACQREQIEAHGVWQKTHSSVAFNSYQVVKTSSNGQPAVSVDPNFALQMMDYCRQTLGERCTLANNSIRDSATTGAPLTADYNKLYDKMKSLGPAITFQTATAMKTGDLAATLDWAIGQGANAVELPADYTKYSAADLSSFNSKLINNSISSQSVPSSPSSSPTPGVVPTTSLTPSPGASTSAASSISPTPSNTLAAPTGLIATATKARRVDLAWTAASANQLAGGYTVIRDGKAIANVNLTSFSDLAVEPNTSYKYKIQTFDKDKHASLPSSELTVTTAKASSTATAKPAAPTSLKVKAGTHNVLATWSAATSDTAVIDYVVTIANQTFVTPWPIYSVVGLSAKTDYTLSVRTRDVSGNLSEPTIAQFKTDCSRFMWWCW